MDGEFESLTSYTSKSKRNYAGLLRFVLCACPLAVPGSVCGGSPLPIADRCASAPSLHPPPAAVGCTARAGSQRSSFGFPP